MIGKVGEPGFFGFMQPSNVPLVSSPIVAQPHFQQFPGLPTIPTIGTVDRNLNDEEQDELDKLEEEHDKKIQQKRREIFKSLLPHIRQQIIDQRYMMEATRRSDNAGNEVDEPQRLRELKYKQSGPFGVSYTNLDPLYPPIGFNYFSVGDLEMLHCEACTEEMIEE